MLVSNFKEGFFHKQITVKANLTNKNINFARY